MRGELLLGGHWDHGRRRVVPMLSGAALMVKREVFDAVGGLDERFHMYGEDHEWCLRVVRAGWQLVFEPSAKVIHHRGQSSAKRWDSEGKLRTQLNAYFHFQHYCLSRAHVISNLLAGCLVWGLQLGWRKLRGREADEAKLILELHTADLKRVLRNNS
jgi:GT2 family glycosyltransferase